MTLASKYIGEICIIFLLLALSILVYSPVVTVSGDMGLWYLPEALNIYKGYGFLVDRFDPDSLALTRGPLFPLLIAGSFGIFGISVASAFYVVKLFCIINVLLIFEIGRKLFSFSAGITAAALVMLSPALGFWSYRHLDSIWVSFFLMSVILYLVWLGNGKIRHMFISGVTVGLSFLVKEVVVVLILYPLLHTAWINSKAIAWKGIAAYFIGLGLTIAPWMVYVYENNGGDITPIFGGLLSKIGNDDVLPQLGRESINLLIIIKLYFVGLCNSFFIILQNYPILPLAFSIWIYSAILAVKGNAQMKLLIVQAALFSPIVAITGTTNLRVGQLSFVVIISYILIAGTIFSDPIKSVFRKAGIRLGYIAFAVALCVVSLDLNFVNSSGDAKWFKDDGMSYWKENRYTQMAMGKGTAEKFSGWFNDNPEYGLNKVSTWLDENIPEGAVIMHDLGNWGYPIYFKTEAKYNLVKLPRVKFKNGGKRISIRQNDKGSLYSKNNSSLINFGGLGDFIENKNVKYILISGISKNQKDLRKLFASDNNIHKVASLINKRFDVYRIERNQIVFNKRAIEDAKSMSLT